MVFVIFYRLFFFVLTVIVGRALFLALGFQPLHALLWAVVLSLFFGAVEYTVARRRPREVLSILLALAITLIVANGTAFVLVQWTPLGQARLWVFLLSNLFLIYVVGSYVYLRRRQLTVLDLFIRRPTSRRIAPKVVDTSALIDGRILDVARTGFLEGDLVVPRFVLRELQHIADSKEHARRVKGRRGLDVLRELQQIPGIRVEIYKQDVPGRAVDHKLLELCRRLDAKLITVDYNLKKLAEVQGIPVLNINELSTVLKPRFTGGEEITVKIQKQGKEAHQGVGYLEDGTMVVVENGAQYIGQTVPCVVTTYLQTDAGRIVFARPKK